MYVHLNSGQTKQCSALLHCRVATAGKLWGPALLLARHCGDKAFVETAAAMAESSTVSGTPLNSVTLLMAGRAEAVHSVPHQTIAAGILLTSVCCPALTVLLMPGKPRCLIHTLTVVSLAAHILVETIDQ